MLTLLATLGFKRRFFEFFAFSHAGVAIFATAATWLHLRAARRATWYYVALSLTLYAVLLLLQISTFLVKNLVQQRRGARAYMSLLGKDGVSLELHLEKPINARPGQFIYLWMAISPLQTHPFMVVSEQDNTLTVLIQSQTGFSRRLKSIAESADSDAAYLSWIDGPYGDPPDFGDYQSVVLVASGIGVAAHLSVLKELVSGYHEHSVKARSVALYWQVESAGRSRRRLLVRR
jgi:predicted ferric reductase